jgi:hypothetical protein
MTREQLAHVLRVAAKLADDPDVLVIGSQSILGSYPETQLPPEATGSMEVDTAFLTDLARRPAPVEAASLPQDNGGRGQVAGRRLGEDQQRDAGLAECSAAAWQRRPRRLARTGRGRVRLALLAVVAGLAECRCPDDGDGSAAGAGTLAAVERVEIPAEAGDSCHR